MKEWRSAAEWADLKLPAMPTSKAGVILRATTGKWRSRPREEQGGGLEYHMSSLPTAAQVKLTLLEKKSRQSAETAAPPANRTELWRWYDGLPDAKKAKARMRAEILDAIVALHRNGVTKDVAVMTVAQHHNVGPSTIYNWLKLVAGHDRADWLPCLAPHHAGRTATVECDPAAWDMLKSDYLRAAAPPFSDCYERMVRAAKEQGWSVPSERTLLRRLTATVHPAVIVMAREGAEKVKQMFPAQERDRSHFTALEAINGDGHRWDLWVEWPDGTVARPNMVAFQDLYSGMILAWRVDQTANSWSVRLAIGDLIEDYGIPKKCWLDNGRDFASKWLTGGIPNRYRFKVREEEPVGILTQLGVEIHWTTPYSGQSKPIERAFRDFASDISRHPAFEGAYTGNSPVNKPENYRSRAIKLEDFLKVLASEINQHNDRIGRIARNCRGRSFRDTFLDSHKDAVVTRATEEQRRLWLLAAEGVTVSNRDGALKLFGNRYWADFLHLHMGETVAARFDPEFLHDGVHVYRLDGVYLGHAPVLEAAGFDSADAAREHARQRRRWLNANKAMLDAERRMSAAQVASLVPLNLGPAAPPEAKVVQLPRPVLDLKQTPKPDLTVVQEERREALVTEFRRPDATPAKDEKTLRLEKAARIEAAITAGTAVEAEAAWFTRYSRQPEWKAFKRLAEDFSTDAQATA
ncbi:transposase [Azospirillum cavernae]|uniref:Transposase n=2 Tax=Azospirillum cavernae TaxID=2320860 RepID=A0A418W498_9PROT|nr:transposase [Azospirillum cavernae]